MSLSKRGATGAVRPIPRAGSRGEVWIADLRLPDGRKQSRTLGKAWSGRGKCPPTHLTRSGAEGALAALLSELNAEFTAHPAMADPGVSFLAAGEEWLRYIEHERQRKASTLSDYRNSFESVYLPFFGAQTRLVDITAERIEDFRVHLTCENRAPATINKHLGQLHGLFKRACHPRGFGLATNPVDAVERAQHRRSGEFNVLDTTEVYALSRAAASEWDAAIFLVAAFTGMRLGELRALRWSDIDWATRLVWVKRSFVRDTMGSPKSHRVRSVPLTDPVIATLNTMSRREAFIGPEDLVFGNGAGDTFDDAALRRRLAKAIVRAGVKRVRFHDLRHTYGSLAVQVYRLNEVQQYMGHAQIATTMGYIHHQPGHDAADRMNAIVSLAPEGVPQAVFAEAEAA